MAPDPQSSDQQTTLLGYSIDISNQCLKNQVHPDSSSPPLPCFFPGFHFAAALGTVDPGPPPWDSFLTWFPGDHTCLGFPPSSQTSFLVSSSFPTSVRWDGPGAQCWVLFSTFTEPLGDLSYVFKCHLYSHNSHRLYLQPICVPWAPDWCSSPLDIFTCAYLLGVSTLMSPKRALSVFPTVSAHRLPHLRMTTPLSLPEPTFADIFDYSFSLKITSSQQILLPFLSKDMIWTNHFSSPPLPTPV